MHLVLKTTIVEHPTMPNSRSTPKPVRGRGGRAGRGGSDRFPVTIKREKLITTGHIVSPNAKQKETKFNIQQVVAILKERSNKDYDYHEVKSMLTVWREYKHLPTSDIETMTEDDIVTELREIQFELINESYENDYTIDEVVHILKGNPDIPFESLNILDLREMLRVWKRHNKEKDDGSDLTNEQVKDTLHDIKLTFEKSEKHEKVEAMNQFDRETDDIFEIVNGMKITKDTDMNTIQKFSNQHLAYFVYAKSLQDPNFESLDKVMIREKKTLIEQVQAWCNEQKKKLNKDEINLQALESDDEEELYKSPFSEANKDTKELSARDDNANNDVNMTDPPESDKLDNNKSVITTINEDEDVVMTDAEEDEQEKRFELHSGLTDQDIKNMTFSQMCQMFHQFKELKGKRINMRAIELWTEEQLHKSIMLEVKNLCKSQILPNKPSNLKTSNKYSSKPTIQSNLQKETHQGWRYSLYFTCPSHIKSVLDLKTHLATLFHGLQAIAKDIKIAPWATDDYKNMISDSEQLPDTITALKKYFDNLRSPVGVSKQYLKVRFSFPILTDRPTFEADATGYLSEHAVKMFLCPVQASNTKVVGWLAYPPNTIDRNKWSRAVQELYIQAAPKDTPPIKVGLAWKALAGQWDVPQKEKVYAMHVEAPSDQGPRVRKFLRLIAQNKKYPMGIRFRLVDQFHQYMKDSTKIKYNYMLDKHKNLTKGLKRFEISSILNLDRRIGSSKMTLRDTVVNIRDNDDDRRIFSTIDTRYDRPDVHVAWYRPDKASKAEAFLESLCTYVKFLHPNVSLEKIFTISALEEAENAVFYPSTQTFLTQDDIDLDNEIQADLDDQSFEYLNPEGINPFELKLPERLPGGKKLFNLSGDDDTASTMPATSSSLTFTDASVHLYDAKSVVSEMTSPSSDIQKQLMKQQNQLSASSNSQSEGKKESAQIA